jgi:hypothetical protein
MLDREMAHRALGSAEERFASLTGGGREFSLLLAAQEEARAALARAQEHATTERRRTSYRKPTRPSPRGRK